MNVETVLITGATGLIGQEFTKFLFKTEGFSLLVTLKILKTL